MGSKSKHLYTIIVSQQKEYKGEKYSSEQSKMGLTFFLSAGNPGPTNLSREWVWGTNLVLCPMNQIIYKSASNNYNKKSTQMVSQLKMQVMK